MEGDPIEWRKWGECTNPRLDMADSEYIQGGGDCGEAWRMTSEFGCTLFEAMTEEK